MSKQKLVAKVFNAYYPAMFRDYLATGGSTYNHEGKVIKGFAVGGYMEDHKSVAVDGGNVSDNDSYWFKHYVRNVVEAYDYKLEKVHNSVGTWYDKENGQFVIDIVRIFLDLDQALEVASSRGQGHIYDLAKGELIKVTAHV